MAHPLQYETAPAEAEAVPTHKEDIQPSSQASLPGWQSQVIEWYAGGERPGPYVMRLATEAGLPGHRPTSAKQKVRSLTLAGFDIEDILGAVPELSAVRVADLVESIPSQAFKILHLHREGFTPVEIAEHLGVARSRVYYWLGQAGLTSNRRQRPELTARQRSQIVKAYEAGEPMTHIVRRFDVTYDQVRYAVKVAS